MFPLENLARKGLNVFSKASEYNVDLGCGAVSYSSLSITQVKIYLSSYLIKHWFQLLNVYLNLTRKQKLKIIMDFCQEKLSQNEDV